MTECFTQKFETVDSRSASPMQVAQITKKENDTDHYMTWRMNEWKQTAFKYTDLPCLTSPVCSCKYP
jgi:hypothetical protein